MGTTFVAYAVPQSKVLTCDRRTLNLVYCQQEDKVLGLTLKQTKLQPLDRAEAKVIGTDEDGRPFYQVILRSQAMKVPFAIDPTPDQQAAQTVANQINQFIQTASRPRLTIGNQRTEMMHLLAGIGAIGLGGFMVYGACKPGRYHRKQTM
ncbi:hypothetical protein [Leptolyngbya sp. 'hensonii']|uniref:hypothetical protein n=1 Tax=Leptolyngbya sp. 'hensonii' TaxID=1922337 RepID=UPI0011807BB1|nr:hypothetical protein [Leptolyngbya sp. 'hensonii']